MPQLPIECLVDALRIDLSHMGCRRVALLGGEREMAADGLRVALARWGFQVLVPPEGERAWIASLSSASIEDPPTVEIRRLTALLADGVEHGVDAIVTTDKGLARVVEACQLGVPTLALDPRGAVVPVRDVVFDMGGVLFRWEPRVQARRFCESDEDGGTRRCGKFGLDGQPPHFLTFQKFGGRRCGNGHQTMCATDGSGTYLANRAVNLIHSQLLQRQACPENVCNRIHRTDFVEMNLLHALPVYRSFRLR